MPRIVRPRFLLLIPLALSLSFQASAFSLLGLRTAWMTPDLSYGIDGLPGGPMNLGEEYRWNLPEITYGFDDAFVDYFGERGVAEVEKAIATLNALPDAAELDPDAYPLTVVNYNAAASALDLFDLRSTALAALLEQVGLTAPEQNVFCLRGKEVVGTATRYFVIQRNFDPLTQQPSRSVNGTLFTYVAAHENNDPTGPVDAFEIPIEPLASNRSTAAGFLIYGPQSGCFLTGLTRDDVGGLRYLLSAGNHNYESLPIGTGGHTPEGSQLVLVAERPGIERLHFTRVLPHSLPLTNSFADHYFVNGALTVQRVERVITKPDITLSARDLGPQRLVERSLGGWNRDASEQAGGPVQADGPGVIEPGGVITFNTVGPLFANVDPTGFGSGEASSISFFSGWASFDGSANPPFVYPASAVPVPVSTLSFKTQAQADGTRLVVWNFRGAIGQPHQIFASSDLNHWEPVGTASAPGGVFEFRLTENGLAPLRFFKAERR